MRFDLRLDGGEKLLGELMLKSLGTESFFMM